ncbi:hypothetical protein RND71_034290 [Anisodus tanguticus]|uniref:Uncharacterized protein n=1 Tax=Anisodus tanguticus TaxID=243964 RepID=A0AAE1V2E6_9SOLA|nr:hypothetical protein RND71_034290 [Anisodus tanguticus]
MLHFENMDSLDNRCRGSMVEHRAANAFAEAEMFLPLQRRDANAIFQKPKGCCLSGAAALMISVATPPVQKKKKSSFDHHSAAALFSLFAAGCAIEHMFGGVVADRISLLYPHSGRIMCAQFSAFMGIPFSWFLLRVVPQSVSSYFTFAVTLFLMGSAISWNSTASNAPVVGILAEKLYGYDAKSVDPMLGSAKEALALSKGLFSLMALPFGLCCLFYIPLYWTFRKDLENARIASIKETEVI